MCQPSYYLMAILFAWNISALAAQQVEIQLRSPSVSCTQTTIRLGDIAELTGGDPAVRARLAELDLDEFSVDRAARQITARQIRYRAVLAGVDAAKFRLADASSIVVQFTEPIDTRRLVERAIHQRLANNFQIPEDSIEVQLLSTIDSLISRSGMDAATLTIEPKLPTEFPLGQRTLELKLSDHAGRSSTTTASVNITLYRDLVMVKENIARGELLDREKLERVRRPIDNPQVSFASYDQAIGRTAQNDIQQFSLIKAQFIAKAEPTESKIVVTRNGLVTILVRQRGLSVDLQNAKANANGRVGETIEFINPRSKAIIHAKIINATTAIIE